MKLAFVVMPWHSLHYPCLAAGLLHSIASQRRPTWGVRQIYANLQWVEHLLSASNGAISPVEYAMLGEELFFSSTGEWAFSSALHGKSEWHVEEYRRTFQGTQEQFQVALAAHRLAPSFVEQLAETIAGTTSVLALTSTFMQNVPCLALAKAVKKLNPAIVTVMGGGNCDGSQGEALHANFPFIDYVVRGEGEVAFDLLLGALEEGRTELSHIPNLSWRNATGTHSNPAGTEVRLDDQPIPVFDDYFDQLERSAIRPYVEPQLVVETARGCWWGEKHHCTFCGLNGTGMHFRSKSATRAVHEIEALTGRYKLLDVIVADNIMDMAYFKTLLPTLKERGWDLRFHYEVKANLKREQIELLRDCGVRHVQPGIESLSTSVLKLMDKGVTGTRNVQMLRDCEEANLTVSWNILAGFPGEAEEEYEQVLRQMPALVHLQPPSGAARIALERFSPYFSKPWLGFADKSPHVSYPVIYGMPSERLADMVYLYQAPPRGICESTLQRLVAQIDSWREAYNKGSQLIERDLGDHVEIEDQRVGWTNRSYELSDPVSMAAHRALRRPLKRPALRRRVEEQGVAASSALEECVERFLESGLVFEDDGCLIGLSTAPVPFRVRFEYA